MLSSAKNSQSLPATVACTGCGAAEHVTILEQDDVPVHQNLLYFTREEAVACRRGNLRLDVCNTCGLVFNSRFQSELLDYAESFENSQDNSPAFLKHMNEIAAMLVDRYALQGKRVLELGCGKGAFLKLITTVGGMVGRGFDPTYEGDLSPAPHLEFVKGFFPGSQPWWNPDLIVCRHVLEHVINPLSFMKSLRQAIGDKHVPIYFEVPNVMWIFENLAFWDIFYEHCNYFSKESITALFNSAGFNVLDVENSFGGQYLSVQAMPSRAHAEPIPACVSAAADKFGHDCLKNQNQVKEKISALISQGKAVTIWGAAAKGSTFLNLLNLSQSQIPFVIDINPNKQGCFIAGTGQAIVAPEHLVKNPVDLIFVMNPIYLDEIRAKLDSLNLHPELHSV